MREEHKTGPVGLLKGKDAITKKASPAGMKRPFLQEEN